MRAAVGENKLLERPSDLRFLQPTGTGFLHGPLRGDTGDIVGPEYMIVDEVRPKPGHGQQAARELLLTALKSAVEELDVITTNNECLTFWVLEYRPEYDDNSLVVVSRYQSKQVYDEISSRTDIIHNLRSVFISQICKEFNALT